MALGRHLVAAHIRSVVWVVPLLLGGSPIRLSGQVRHPVSLIICSNDTRLGLPSSDAHSKKIAPTQRFTGALKARNVVLTTYRELIAKQGLKAMRRPAG
jgi:hypothetical protein